MVIAITDHRIIPVHTPHQYFDDPLQFAAVIMKDAQS